MKDPGFQVVGFDCSEEEHVAVLLDEAGEQEWQVKTVNQRDRIQECLARLILAAGESSRLVVVVESKRAHGRLVVEESLKLGCEVMQALVAGHAARVQVLPCSSIWHGFTHPADREPLVRALARMVREGRYPSPLPGHR